MNNEKKFIKLTPFKMQVLQSFPFIDADFDAITNYELLCKVVEYLNITVDNVNLLNEKVEEFQHYFDNLDVQEEINNKLDDMAESGELADIIAQYLGLAGVLAFDTVADMKEATNLVNGSTCQTLGFHSKNDNGSAIYKIRNITNMDIVDEITIISLHNSNLIAELITKEFVTPEMFGAYGDNIHDDNNSLLKAFNSGCKIVANKVYKATFNGSLYSGGSNVTNNINVSGGTFNLSGRLNFSKNLILDNVTINGNVYFTGINYTGDIVSITNSFFDVGELTFRLNNVDFKNVIIENNFIKFYGAFWSSSQTEGKSKGNVYIKNNEFYGKEVQTHTESYYCACVVENEYVEFSGNYCHDFITDDTTKSVHDGYFSSNYAYVHDNTVINLDGGSSSNNAILKSKSDGKKYFINNYYEITSDINFPFLQIQNSDSEWHVENCTFNIANCTETDHANNAKCFINNCSFNIGTLNGYLMGNDFNMNNCEININTMVHNCILALNNGEIKNCNINVSNTGELTNYGAITGYTNFNNVIDNVKSNIYLIQYQFIGTIKNSLIYVLPSVFLGELINCTTNTRYFLIFDNNTNYKFNVNIITNGNIYGTTFNSTDSSFTYVDNQSTPHVQVTHNTANNRGAVTIFNIDGDTHNDKALISILKTRIN